MVKITTPMGLKQREGEQKASNNFEKIEKTKKAKFK